MLSEPELSRGGCPAVSGAVWAVPVGVDPTSTSAIPAGRITAAIATVVGLVPVIGIEIGVAGAHAQDLGTDATDGGNVRGLAQEIAIGNVADQDHAIARGGDPGSVIAIETEIVRVEKIAEIVATVTDAVAARRNRAATIGTRFASRTSRRKASMELVVTKMMAVTTTTEALKLNMRTRTGSQSASSTTTRTAMETIKNRVHSLIFFLI